ncbi:VIT1/CCC1 transporter family protein [Kitasatospora sp. NPDC127059]|uniref:VIT1/CCC1 transporter family protein n=1 Tax=Kitasatospora sp. NPDC127059 TaxID=3347120 RepID=UPI0036574CC7
MRERPRASRAIGPAVVRITFGLLWAVDASFKWLPGFIRGRTVPKELGKAATIHAPVLHQWTALWHGIVDAQPGPFAVGTALTGTCIALGLIFGVLSTLVFIGSAVFSFGIWSAAEAFHLPWTKDGITDPGPSVAYIFASPALLRASAGAAWSLDTRLRPPAGPLRPAQLPRRLRPRRVDALTGPPPHPRPPADRPGAAPPCRPRNPRTAVPGRQPAPPPPRLDHDVPTEAASTMTRRARTAPHTESHAAGRAGWLRAAVLGANDGLVSIASLMVGLAAAGVSTSAVVTGGLAGLSAGSLSMAAGEYVSVSSQVDVETADRAKEARELAEAPEAELAELTGIYESRGVPSELARQVAEALHRADPLQAHLRDELGHSEHSAANPLQAALASAASFLVGGLVPFLGLLASTDTARLWLIVAVTVCGLALAGALAARAAGTALLRPTLRVVVGGGIAMAITAAVGQLAHVAGV